MWYAIKAYNSETLYGWTEDEAVVNAAVDRLNAGRHINMWASEPLDVVAFGRERWSEHAGATDVDPSEAELVALAEKSLNGGHLLFDADTVAS